MRAVAHHPMKFDFTHPDLKFRNVALIFCDELVVRHATRRQEARDKDAE